MTSRADVLGYYASAGVFTHLDGHGDRVAALSADPGEMAAVLQGLVVHEHFARAYGVTLSDQERASVHVRPAAELLSLIAARDDRPLTELRPPSDRIAGNCRHFSTLAVAILRAHGVPARARCGFGAYFVPGRFEDHWVCEYWRADEGRWALVDAQIDHPQRRMLGVGFDPTDVSRDAFVTGGDAWVAVREGRADPGAFGLSVVNESGAWWVVQNLIRDVMALRKVEVLPWDCWGAMPGPDDHIDEELAALLDRLAALTADPDASFDDLAELSADERVAPGGSVLNAVRGREEPLMFSGMTVEPTTDVVDGARR